MEESNCNSYLQEVQERGPRELQADQPHLDPQGGEGTAPSGKHFQAHEREKKTTRIHQGEVMPDQLDKLL